MNAPKKESPAPAGLIGWGEKYRGLICGKAPYAISWA